MITHSHAQITSDARNDPPKDRTGITGGTLMNSLTARILMVGICAIFLIATDIAAEARGGGGGGRGGGQGRRLLQEPTNQTTQSLEDEEDEEDEDDYSARGAGPNGRGGGPGGNGK